jgi:tRNA threonylcarbamoyladenosine biosynthesis protein TsaE
MKEILLASPDQTEQAGADLAKHITAPAVIFLEGQLGAGKTTFVRGFLRGLGVTDIIKSPTFTLIETYDVGNMHIMHADLYRLKSADELEALGFRDYFTEKNIILIEWASYAENVLPKPTLHCTLRMPREGDGRILNIEEAGAPATA